jgi:hypothetical protein
MLLGQAGPNRVVGAPWSELPRELKRLHRLLLLHGDPRTCVTALLARAAVTEDDVDDDAE